MNIESKENKMPGATERTTGCHSQAFGSGGGVKHVFSMGFQVAIICVLHFWVGVGIGRMYDLLQQAMSPEFIKPLANGQSRAPLSEGDKNKLRWEITLVVILLTLTYIAAQSILRYMYLFLMCLFTGEAPKEGSDAHAMHWGFAMFYGVAWSSGTTLTKLTITLD